MDMKSKDVTAKMKPIPKLRKTHIALCLALGMTTGEIKPVEGTPMDFRAATPLSLNINNTEFDQTRNATGFDHNWCLASYANGTFLI